MKTNNTNTYASYLDVLVRKMNNKTEMTNSWIEETEDLDTELIALMFDKYALLEDNGNAWHATVLNSRDKTIETYSSYDNDILEYDNEPISINDILEWCSERNYPLIYQLGNKCDHQIWEFDNYIVVVRFD